MFNCKKAARIAWLVTAASLLVVCAGCAGAAAWLSDASAILPLVSGTTASILTLIAALQGGTVSASDLTAVSTFATDIQSGIQDLEALVNEFKANGSTTTQGEVIAAAQAITDNIGKFLTDTHLANAALASKVTAIVSVVQSELQAWIQVIPALSAAAHTLVSFTVPLNAKEYKSTIKEIWATPTGDVAVDAATAKIKI